MKKYYVHRFFDKSGRRISLYAEPLNGQKLVVTWWAASNKDAFSKKRSWVVKELITSGYHTHAEIKDRSGITVNSFVLDIKGENPKNEFLQWVRENYYTYAPVICIKQKLVKGTEKQFYDIMSKPYIKK